MTTSAMIDAIFEYADTMVAGSPALPIFFDGIAVKPPSKPKYLWVQVAPNDTERPGVSFSDTRVHQGVILINVWWSNGTGMVAPTRAADDVRAHWIDGTRIEGTGCRIEINKPPSIRPRVQEGAAMFVPVAIEYRAVEVSA